VKTVPSWFVAPVRLTTSEPVSANQVGWMIETLSASNRDGARSVRYPCSSRRSCAGPTAPAGHRGDGTIRSAWRRRGAHDAGRARDAESARQSSAWAERHPLLAPIRTRRRRWSRPHQAVGSAITPDTSPAAIAIFSRGCAALAEVLSNRDNSRPRRVGHDSRSPRGGHRAMSLLIRRWRSGSPSPSSARL